MDFMRYAKWVAIVTLLLALLSTPLITLHIPVSLEGTVYDNGPNGYTALVNALRASGHSVILGLPDPNDTRGEVTILVLNPRFCTSLTNPQQDYARLLMQWISRNPRVKQVMIVGEDPCAAYFLRYFVPSITSVSRVAVVSFTLNGVRIVEPTGLVVKIGASVTPFYEYPPGALSPSFAFIGGSDFLRNSEISKHPEYLKAFLSLIAPGATVVVYTLPETGDAGLALSPYMLAVLLLYAAVHIERSVYAAAPLAIILPYTLLAAILVYRYIGRGIPSHEEPLYYRPEPSTLIGVTRIYERLVSVKKLATSEAILIIDRLYDILDAALRYYLGAGVEGVVKNPRVLEKLSALSGVPQGDIYRLVVRLYRLRRKIRGLAIRPLFVRWHKEATVLTEMASRLLKNLGVELERIHGLEVLLEHGELGAGEEAGRSSEARSG